MQYEYEAVRSALDAHKEQSGVRRITLYLTKGDSAWNPANTKTLIDGPATVSYEEFPDGAINAYIN